MTGVAGKIVVGNPAPELERSPFGYGFLLSYGFASSSTVKECSPFVFDFAQPISCRLFEQFQPLQ
jgi:hypothetical protein